jgi:urease accessory protein
MRRLPIVLATLVPTAALAHPGVGAHGAPFAAGLAHPVLGPDHLLAMIAVGLLAATTGGPARWAYPASFVAAMGLGGALGFEGAPLPVIEPTILASVVVLGAAIAFALRPALPLACAVIALFGIAHGYAHGLAGPELGGLQHAAGFVLSTAALHALGVGFGFAASRARGASAARALGGLTCLAGFVLLVG